MIPAPEEIDRIEDTMRNRCIARKLVNDAASEGNPIAGQLEAFEHLTTPYYLGLDSDPDASDLDVYP